MLFNDDFFKHHITFSATPALKEIKSPLEFLDIYYFGYQAIYNDGAQIRLSSCPEWMRYYYKNKLFNFDPFAYKKNIDYSTVLPWEYFRAEPISYLASTYFRLDNGVTILEKQKSFYEIYHFSPNLSRKKEPLFLMNHIPSLYRFIAYFKEKAKDLLTQAHAARFVLPFEPIKKSSLIGDTNNKKIQTYIAAASQKMDIKKLFLGERFDNAYLTRRELDIINLLIKGKTAVDIAKQLKLSTKTMETHLSHIKEKFKCHTLLELGFLLGIMQHHLLLN